MCILGHTTHIHAVIKMLQMETTTFSLGHPFHQILHRAISFFGGLLKAAFMYHHSPRSDNACTVGHYSGHATPGLGWVWLACGCVSCDQWRTYWRSVINAWETWIVATADGVCYAGVRWEINFLLTFETTPFFCVYSVLWLTLRDRRCLHLWDKSEQPSASGRLYRSRGKETSHTLSFLLMSSTRNRGDWWPWFGNNRDINILTDMNRTD
jgi:hypothetical protein